MLINHNEKSFNYQSFSKNKKSKSLEIRQVNLLSLLWALVIVFFRHGNLKVYYHICGSLGEDSWDCPMEAEGLGIRMTNLGKKLTIW